RGTYFSSLVDCFFPEDFAQRQTIRSDIVIAQRIRLIRIVKDGDHPRSGGRILTVRQERELGIDSPNWKEISSNLSLERVCHRRRVRIFHNRGLINYSYINHSSLHLFGL